MKFTMPLNSTPMYRIGFIILSLFDLGYPALAQHPLKNPVEAVEIRYARSHPVIGYTLMVDAMDLSAITMEMRLRNIPDTFRLAMVAHPEYDDHFWRFVKDLRADSKTGPGNVLREDSALWRIVAAGGEVVVRYRIQLPPPGERQRAAWRPFLSPTGGLVGGPHSFMYVLGAELAPSHITVKLPQEWVAATGLEPTADGTTFFAPSVGVLVDSPILIGNFKHWQFTIDQVPHRVVYWTSPKTIPFDTASLVTHIQKFVQQAATLFGRLPYREYSFLLQDEAYGALEHRNSVTLGMPSGDLAKDISSYLPEIAHEYFHTWNLMRIHPVEYGDVSYKPQALSRGLWWSEGLTLFYADLLTRRAGLPDSEPSRTKHLEQLISRYYGNPGNSRLSAEEVSLASYGPPGMLGDYNASAHLQGEVLGTMLDFVIRDATNGNKSMDDVMRAMMEHFSGTSGFTSKDIAQLISEICGRTVQPFFEDHVFGNKPIDFDAWLPLAGIHSTMTWTDAAGADGKPYADLRVYAFQSPGDPAFRIGITDPSGCWGRAGLHTGDVILSLNKSALKSRDDFWQALREFKIGDIVALEIQRPTGKVKMKVTISGYRQPVVRIEEIKDATERQRKVRAMWVDGL